MSVIDIANRLELFVDELLIDNRTNVNFKLHQPVPDQAPMGFTGQYMTILKDADQFIAYYRVHATDYKGEKKDGNDGEMTCRAVSSDGINWTTPTIGKHFFNGTAENNGVLRITPFSHNFSPFIDTNPSTPPAARFKALAGTHKKPNPQCHGLHAFSSPDGVDWSLIQPTPVFDMEPFGFDSQNVSFWSEVEGCYVCYFRSWETTHGRLRTISRITSPDFIHWSEPVSMNPNLPGEHLYTSQTTPYFRAPHVYLALSTRFSPARGSSTDILFMSTRAGSTSFNRLFTEAFLRPGPDPDRWGNRSNYAARGIHPAGEGRIAFYHAKAGIRYTLRTDGFISLNAGAAPGTVTTKPFTFTGSELKLNVATSAVGTVKVELQTADGVPIPTKTLADSQPIFGDEIARTVTWTDGANLIQWQGKPVRLHMEMCEADVYAIQFG